MIIIAYHGIFHKIKESWSNIMENQKTTLKPTIDATPTTDHDDRQRIPDAPEKVNHPDHYQHLKFNHFGKNDAHKYETLDTTESINIALMTHQPALSLVDFELITVLKYLARAPFKLSDHGLTDYEKAAFYSNRMQDLWHKLRTQRPELDATLNTMIKPATHDKHDVIQTYTFQRINETQVEHYTPLEVATGIVNSTHQKLNGNSNTAQMQHLAETILLQTLLDLLTCDRQLGIDAWLHLLNQHLQLFLKLWRQVLATLPQK